MTTRRRLLQGLAAAAVAPARFVFAATPGDRRLVVVILRGALDGLSAAPPYGDTDYAPIRGKLALDKDNGLHDLDGFFGLNPGLTSLKTYYDARQLLVFQNICSPYRDRSHFDGQEVLETGGDRPHVFHDGWLNRALKPMGVTREAEALAVAQTQPLMLLGPSPSTSWMPAALPAPDEVFLNQVRALYADDAVLRDFDTTESLTTLPPRLRPEGVR